MRGLSLPNHQTSEYIWLTSNISSNPNGGMMDCNALASMVLPLPGEPTMSRLWSHATATARARLAMIWPLISAKSTSYLLLF